MRQVSRRFIERQCRAGYFLQIGQDIQGAQSLLEQVGGPADLEHDDGIALLFIGAELAVHLVGGSGAGSHLGNSQRIQRKHDVVGGDLLTVAPEDIVPQGQGVGGTVLADVQNSLRAKSSAALSRKNALE